MDTTENISENMTFSKTRNMVKLLVCIIIPQIAGLISSYFSLPSLTTWYEVLWKPSFTLPAWVFSPVWTWLYLMMGVSAYFVLRKPLGRWDVRLALFAFLVQLVLNVLWSFFFFGMASPVYGLIDIGGLWVCILVTIIFFSKVSRRSGLLLIPYLIWVSYIAILNIFIWQMNR